MRSYIITLTALSFLASIIAALVPDGQRGGLKRHTKLLCSLVLICVMIGPIISFVESLSEVKFDFLPDIEEGDSQELFVESISKMSAAQLENELTVLLEARFDINKGELKVRVEYTTDGETMTVTRTVVTLSGTAIFKSPYEIEDYVKRLTNVECDCVL